MKRKITLVVTGTALAAAIAVGGTLAWFTDTKAVKNVVTFGNVSISLTETGLDSPSQEINNYGIVMPGDKILKDPTITNTSTTNACYVRVSAPLNIDKETNPQKVAFTLNDLGITANDGWVFKDGYYYYTKPLTVGSNPVKPFKEFKVNDSSEAKYTILINPEWNSNYANVKFDIPVTAEAIQTENNAAEAQWPVTINADGSLSLK